jgi:hypothetical protein
MRIVILSVKDYAGSGWGFAQALRRAGHHATLITAAESNFGKSVDLCVNTQDLISVAQQMVDAADVIHFKGDHLPQAMAFLRTDHKPRVFTAGGSGFRRAPGHEMPRNLRHRWHPLAEYRRAFHAYSAITPDLLYRGLLPGIRWIPHALPMDVRWMPPPTDGEIIIGHSPSSRASKGTDTVVVPAVQMVRRLGYPVRLLLLEGMSNVECMAAKASCHLFIDQAHIPAYGLSAVEAMVMGIPVVSRMPRPPFRKGHPLHGHPVAGFYAPNPTACAGAIIRALDDLPAMHSATVAWAKRIHAPDMVTRRLLSLYRSGIRNWRGKA